MTEKHSPLLPCPFCGQPAVTHEWKDSGGNLHIECGNDDGCPVTVDIQAPPAVAIAAWNTRAVNGLPEAIAALEAAEEYISVDTDMPAADAILAQVRAALTKLKG